MSYGDPSGLLFMNDGINPAPWWESDDISIPGDQAQVGANTVTVTGRKNVGTLSSSQVRIEAYIANPSFVMSPTNTPYTRKIGKVDLNVSDLDTAGPATGVSAAIVPDLTIPPPPPADPNDAVGLGHRCIVARIFPKTFTPPTSAFTPDVEQHECQRNISVVLVRMLKAEEQNAAGAGKGQTGLNREWPLLLNLDGLLDFRIDTAARTSKAEDVLLRATWANGNPGTRHIAARLKRTRVFRGFARKPPEGFAYNVKLPLQDIPHAKGQKPYIPKVLKVKDGTKNAKLPRYDALVRLQPKKPARVALNVNLGGSSTAGLAHVFYLEQLTAKGKPQGGITLVFVPMS
jgi:hypothetical protein